jgi:hypothetical protein
MNEAMFSGAFGAIIETLRHTAAPRILVDELDRVVAELKRLPM